MRKFLYVIAGLPVLFILAACINEQTGQVAAHVSPPVVETIVHSDKIDVKDYDDDFYGVRSHWQGLHMYVNPGSVTPTGLRLSMINSSEKLNFGHGVMFRIEQYSDAGWSEVPVTGNIAWILPLLHVAPSTTVDEDISWEHMYGELPPGQYRVVRSFIEEELFNPIPAWQRDIPEAYIYAVFTVDEDWQAAHGRWQSEQDELAAIAYARFEGLDLEILEYSPRGLSFTLTNNNSEYSYIIVGAFVGWEDIFPDGGFAGSVEYFIYSRGFHGDSWPFGSGKRLQPGEYLSLAVDWYDEIGYLAPSMERYSPNPYTFELIVDVMLDVDEEY
ncbi:MAG: hypothetical protein FWE92_04120, partial [Defluviitaleaceae bacterium]|nr:hypothetical protein [Defluviitaleaceae bacterium]